MIQGKSDNHNGKGAIRPVEGRSPNLTLLLWTEASRRLAELEDRRTTLLLKCTPFHPSVREIESQAAAVRIQTASIQPRVVAV
jgi:hypothetical protein